MFRTRPLRTSLTILGVSVGIAAVFFLVCLGYGLQQTILNRIANAESLLTLDVSAGSDAVLLTPVSVEKLRTVEHVQDIARLASFSAQISVGSLTSDLTVNAVDPSFFRLSGATPLAGSFFFDPAATDGPDSAPSANTTLSGAILSSAAVKLFGLTPEESLNRQVAFTLYLPTELPDGKVTVQEFSATSSIVGVTDNEDTSVLLVPFSLLSGITIDRFDQVKIRVDKNTNMQIVRDSVVGNGFIVASLSDTIDQATKIFKIVQLVLSFFGLVALVVSAIGMFNTMTITLMERTNEIGIMRSIGMTRRDIRTMFLVESMVMGFLGGMAGLTLGTLAGQGVNLGMNLLAQRFNGPAVNLFLSPFWFVAVIVGFSTIIGLLTGIYPSVRAARLNPLDALRYK